MDVLIMAAQLILGLTILVGLHELGHFVPAKLFGMRVDQFSIGFPPKIFGIQWKGTEYSIGSIPLGGFVKIAGMIDESIDTNHLSKEPQPWEFRSKPAYQRLVVMIGGVTVNLLAGIVIFIFLTYSQGERFLPASEVKYGIVAYPIAEEIGLKTGDKILDVNGKKVEKFREILSMDVLLESGSYFTVSRGSEILKIDIPNNLVDRLTQKKSSVQFIDPIYPYEVSKVMEGSAASKAGLQKGDKIRKVDEDSTIYFHELQAALKKRSEQIVHLTIERNHRTIELEARVSKEGKLGFVPNLLLKDSLERYSLVASAGIGTMRAFEVVVMQFKAFKKIFSGDIDVRNSLSGPIGIAKEFGGTWDWLRFWSLTGLISMILAFMNLLPIPALDGGHVMFLTYEIVTGRRPSDNFLLIAQKVGMFLLLGLTVFSFANDIFKLFE